MSMFFRTEKGGAVINERFRISMRASLVLTILAMGALGMFLTFFSGEAYRYLTLDTQRGALADYMRAETNQLREQLGMRVRALSQHAELHAPFVKAFVARSAPTLTTELDALYTQITQMPGTTRIDRIYLFDGKWSLLASSSAGDISLVRPPCAENLSQVSADAVRLPRLCVISDKPYYVAAAPLAVRGGAYLYVVSDLISGLRIIEKELGTPLQLRYAGGTTIYRSTEWPDNEQIKTRALASYPVPIFMPKPASLELDAARDMTVFYDQLSNLRYLVSLAVAALTIFAMSLALLALEHTSLKPLRMLQAQLQRVRQDKRNLGEQVKIHGNVEITELAEGFNDMTARLRELYESLERMAFTDALTGLPNRSLFNDRLQQVILNSNRDTKPFALLFMDLDHFKDINDTLGHHIGDALLTQVAQRLRGKLRASDTVARMGGDEFAVLLPAVDAKHAGMAARMLLQALRAPFTVDEYNFGVGASIGIALYPENGVDANVLMQRADVAMYAAKGSGTGFSFYNPAIDRNYPRRLTLLTDLRQAVEHEQFELFYQPIVSLLTDKVIGIEALVRWRHPRDGILLPDSFIPLLEQSGMIHGLMPWVVSEALKHAHALQQAGVPLIVSVNLSMRDLQDANITDSFAELLGAHDVDASLISLEVTESAVMTDPPRTFELLNKLSAMGLRIAIDDFGTGYSSLTYLKKLPVTTLKIDKSFVCGMVTDSNDAAIVRTSIDLAHNLGLKVVAEGVENEVALKQLKSLGCDLAQGHYVGRPFSRTELAQWLAQSAWGLNGAELDPEQGLSALGSGS
jgi:diguanylate cyclase (GGDEF)-like protein